MLSVHDGDDPEIAVRGADGALRVLTDNRAGDWDPVWSPDGTRIAFVSDRAGDADVWVMRADGTQQQRLTLIGPAPDGTRIAFLSTRDGGEAEIYVMQADGSHGARITRTADHVADHGPDWSPDGRQIAFSSNRVSFFNHEIYRMRPDGSGLRRMTRTADGVDENAPAWSPDGRRITSSSNRSGTHDVYTMNRFGYGVRHVTGDPALDDVFPRWSRDGRTLVFWTFAGPDGTPSADVWAVRTDGSGRRTLAGSAADETGPDAR